MATPADSAASAPSKKMEGGQALLSVQHGSHTLEKVVLVHPTGHASVEVYLLGATVTSWKIMGQEMLYLSPKANYEPGKAIRGGVPVVFPQFGPGVLPQHGFARNQIWKLGETSVQKSSGDITTTFTLEDNPDTRAQWPNHFRLTLSVCLKLTAVSMQLKVQNLNSDARPFSFTTLLHTYLRVDSIEKTTVRGLKGKQYVDQVDGMQIKDEPAEAVVFRSEVDRMYCDGATGPVSVNDGGNCEVLVKCAGFRDMVVWNPHVAKSAKMSDLPADDWKGFVCVEAGSVIEPVTLQAGESWEGSQGLSLQMLPELGEKLADKIAEAGSTPVQATGPKL